MLPPFYLPCCLVCLGNWSLVIWGSLGDATGFGCTDTAVTTVTVSAVIDGCPNLQMLDLSCTGPVSRDCLFRLAFSLQAISRLKLSHTAYVSMPYCSRRSSEGQEHLAVLLLRPLLLVFGVAGRLMTGSWRICWRSFLCFVFLMSRIAGG